MCKIGLKCFTASNGWSDCFKNRHNFSYHKICCESAEVDGGVVWNFQGALDMEMGTTGRKILLNIDKCPPHPQFTFFLSNVKVAFLPANCTSEFQPLDSYIL